MKETGRRPAHADRARVVIASLIPRSLHTLAWYENETIHVSEFYLLPSRFYGKTITNGRESKMAGLRIPEGQYTQTIYGMVRSLFVFNML